MTLHAHTIKTALLIMLTLALASCGKQEEQPKTETPTPIAASAPPFAPSFPTGNEAKPMTEADCDKLPDPKPVSAHSMHKAIATIQGQGARRDCKRALAAQKYNADLARIREIKEREEAERDASKMSEEEQRRRLKEGAAAPIKEYKY